MRGTQRVGSLLRLFLGAAFVCLAWVLLSSTQADAAERPAPVELIASVAEPVTGSVAVAAPAPVREDPVAAVADTTKPVVAPVVEQLRRRRRRRSTPPRLGSRTSPQPSLCSKRPSWPSRTTWWPWPTPSPWWVVIPLSTCRCRAGSEHLRLSRSLSWTSSCPRLCPTNLRILVQNNTIRPSWRLSSTRCGGWSWQPSTRTREIAKHHSCAVGDRAPLVSGAPQPSELPEPWPSPQSPMPPTQSVPSPGGGASSVDLASAGPAIVLPSPTTWGRTSSDWRVPRGLPDRPGSRPD